MTKTTHSGATQAKLAAKIDANILAVKDAEKVTKSKLAILSRDCLTYLVLNGSNDVAIVDRLLNVLTPMNQATAKLYFNHFLPWKFDKEKGKFGNKLKGEKKLADYYEKVDSWLADKSNNIWTWAADNVKLEEQKDYSSMVARTIKKALEGETTKTGFHHEPISAAEVLASVVEGGVTLDDMMALIEAATEADDDEEINTLPVPTDDASEAPHVLQ